MDGGHDKVTVVEKSTEKRSAEKQDEGQSVSLNAIVKSIDKLTKNLQTVKNNQEDMVSCMLAAGGQPCPGKGKGRGKRSTPQRDTESPVSK